MNGLREELESAFDEVENEGTDDGAEDTGVQDDAGQESDGDVGENTDVVDDTNGDDGDTGGDDSDAGDKDDVLAEGADDGAEADQTDQQRADSDVKIEKPPVGWSPKNREHWANLPDELKTQINKREREVNQVLQQTAHDRKVSQAFTQTIEPYKAAMVAQGVTNPMVAIENLMQTAATLGMGTPQQKAMRIAGLIQHYGVDIKMLDGALAGNVEQQAPDQQTEIQNAVNQALQPFVQQQQAAQQQSDAQMRGRVAEGIKKIAEREFFNDVRNDMADIMEMASKRGQVVTLEQAYDRAVQMNPEISSVLAARQQQSDLASKKKAASAISGNKSGVNAAPQDMSLHDQLSAAWDAH